MKLSLIVFMLLFAISANAQMPGIINDPDGYVNVRNGKSASALIIGRLHNGDIVFIDDQDNGDWRSIEYFSKNELLLSDTLKLKKSITYSPGYLHKSRIIPFVSLPKMIHRKDIGFISPTRINGRIDTISVSIKVKSFKANSHKITRRSGFVNQIDGKHPWGIDGELPTKEITDIVLTINGNNVSFPKESYDDLFQPGRDMELRYDDKNNIYIHTQNSDGAGGYDAVWVVNHGKFIRRYLDNGNV